MKRDNPARLLKGGFMRIIAGCPNGNCPKVIDDGSDEVTVVGPTRTDVETPDGEGALRIPVAVILEAADALRARP